MKRISEVKRLCQSLPNGIQDHQLAIAAADFGFSLLALRDIEQESLIRSHDPIGVPNGHGRLQHGSDFSVLAAHFEFEIGDRAMLLQELLQPVTVADFEFEM